MEVGLWAEIRRLKEVEKLTQRAIARRLHCCTKTVQKALKMREPPTQTPAKPAHSILDPYGPRIDALIGKYPELSAVRVLEEISKGDDGYSGGVSLVRRYLRQIRPVRGRIYQEVFYEPGEAMQVDWGECGRVMIGNTSRRVSVLVATLCFSRYGYIEFSLSQKKADFYRALVHALNFFGGSPRKIIFDNLKAAVLNGSGRHACFHPEFLALCGHFCMEPIACARRDPESKGISEASVRYVKRNALQGREEELSCWEDYPKLASYWLEKVANVRIHESTKERPLDRFEKERGLLRPLPTIPFDTDEIVSALVTPHARVNFDGNRYSAPPELARKTIMIRADARQVRVFYQGAEVACHARCYERGQLVCQTEHQLAALQDAKPGTGEPGGRDLRRLGASGAGVPPGVAQAPPEDHRSPSPPAEPGAALRPTRRAGGDRAGGRLPDVRRRLCGNPLVAGATAAGIAFSDAVLSATSRLDGRDRLGGARPGRL